MDDSVAAGRTLADCFLAQPGVSLDTDRLAFFTVNIGSVPDPMAAYAAFNVAVLSRLDPPKTVPRRAMGSLLRLLMPETKEVDPTRQRMSVSGEIDVPWP